MSLDHVCSVATQLIIWNHLGSLNYGCHNDKTGGFGRLRQFVICKAGWQDIALTLLPIAKLGHCLLFDVGTGWNLGRRITHVLKQRLELNARPFAAFFLHDGHL